MIIRHQSSNKPQITPIKAFQDNYIWALIEDQNLIIVDPGDAKPVLDFISHSKLNLLSILITHKHLDHIGGVDDIYANYPNTEIYGTRPVAGSIINTWSFVVPEPEAMLVM